MSNNISPKIIRVKDIVTDLSLFDNEIDHELVDQIAGLLLQSAGMLIYPLIVTRDGHDKYRIFKGHEIFAAALSLKGNKNFRGLVNCFVISIEEGDAQDGDATIELIQNQLEVLIPSLSPSPSQPPPTTFEENELIEETQEEKQVSIPSASTSKPKLKYRPLSEEEKRLIEKNGRESMGKEPLPFGFKARKRKMTVARLQVFNCLKDGYRYADDIAKFLQKKVGTIRAMLAKMFLSEYTVLRPDRGAYELTKAALACA